jgi:hypothetical protein
MQVVRSDLQRHSNDGVVLMEGKGTTRCRKGICIRVATQLARDSLQQWKTTSEKTNHGGQHGAVQHETWWMQHFLVINNASELVRAYGMLMTIFSKL